MQTVEQVTPNFILKLSILFILLFSGFMLKTTKVAQPASTQQPNQFKVSTSVPQDSQYIKPPHLRMVDQRVSSEAPVDSPIELN